MPTRKSNASKSADLLASHAANAGLKDAEIQALRTWLAELLVAQEFAKLGQGGHTNTQIPLRQVFVDLPISESGESSQTASNTLFLRSLLEAGPAPVDQMVNGWRNPFLDTDERSPEGVTTQDARYAWSAVLLIGGPGQGKSTVGQLACQLHRAGLLIPTASQLPTSQRDLVHSFGNPGGGQANGLCVPGEPSIPLQIVLPELAAWLAMKGEPKKGRRTPQIVEFAASLPSAKISGLSESALWRLFQSMPSLIVLDGLDEVGSVDDRENIVVATRELVMALARVNASSQLVVTTRPQGYADEMSRIGLKLHTKHLSPLQLPQAIEYANKLIEAKIPGVDEREKAKKQVNDAAREPATVRLLTTPLQVTILTALIQQLGRAPRERWNLFSRYFSYTYDREIERNSYASALLAEHRSHVEQIHARVALLLQVEAERDGGAAARMPRSRLEEIITAVLSEDEVAEPTRALLVREIATAAENRLVFLVEPEPGKIGFEIRSLQEFMAAWALTSGRDAEVESRLLHVCKASMFRNVSLFMASRFFSEGSPLRDVLVSRALPAMQSDDPATRVSCAGALFALETLEEGAALSQPKRARALMSVAVDLLTLPPSSDHVRLVRAAGTDTFEILGSGIDSALGGAAHAASNSASWVCLVDATNRDESWAHALAEKHWNPSVLSQGLIEDLERAAVPLGHWIAEKIETHGEHVNPWSFIDPGPHTPPPEMNPTNWIGWLLSSNVTSRFWLHARASGLVKLKRPHTARYPVSPDRIPPTSWQGWISAFKFEASPSAQTLGEALLSISNDKSWKNLQLAAWRFSWPLSACLGAAASADELRKFSELALGTKLGDYDDWLAAESGWSERQLFRGIVVGAKHQQPWTRESIAAAPPLFALPMWMVVNATDDIGKRSVLSFLRAANESLVASKSANARARLAEICLTAWRRLPSTDFSLDEVSAWIRLAPGCIGLLVPKPPSVASTLEWMRLLSLCVRPPSNAWQADLTETLEAWTQTGYPGLLRLAVDVIRFQDSELTPRSRVGEHMSTAVSLAFRETSLEKSAAADLATLRLALGTESEEDDEACLETIALRSSSDRHVWYRFFMALQSSGLSIERIGKLATHAFPRLVSNRDKLTALRKVRDGLQQRRSLLDSTASWNRLGLPLPYPRPGARTDFAEAIPSRAVRLESVELLNIGRIGRLRLDLHQPDTDTEGQWTVLVGPNGSGKTTVLRSLALALRSVRHPEIWPKGAFATPWRRIPRINDSELLESQIKINVANLGEHRTLIRNSVSISITQLPEQDTPRLFPIFAYGCRRGSALGGASRQVYLGDDNGPEVATLFDDGADLIQAETWLIALEADAGKSDRSRVLFSAVVQALIRLLNLDSLDVSEQRLWAVEPHGSRVPFSSLSDGFLTSAGWFLDLIARWVTLAEREGVILGADFLSRVRGLVLIDEIDLHLHPLAQVSVITKARSILPQMSFVVTTHNPLALVGARPEEIWILSKQQGEIAVRQGTDPPSYLTGAQLYKRYFDIDGSFPSETGHDLMRLAFLSGYPLRNDEEERELQVLIEKLDGVGVQHNWEIVPRRTEAIPPASIQPIR